MIQILRNYWIPTKTGEFRKPQAMNRDDLRDDFPFNNSNGLLTAIEFGKDTVIQAEEERKRKEQQNDNFKQRDMFAKESGFESLDEMEDFADLAKELKARGKTAAEIREFLNPKKPDFSDNTSANPTRRADKVKEEAENAPEKIKEKRPRSVSVYEWTKVQKEAKEYLKNSYTVEDILYCQICKKEMPFKVDGNYYFEAVSLLGDVSKAYQANFIALCPLDAAKFKHANKQKDEMAKLIRRLIKDRDAEDINDGYDDENSIELELADEAATLTFSPKHLIDIQATLDVEFN